MANGRTVTVVVISVWRSPTKVAANSTTSSDRCRNIEAFTSASCARQPPQPSCWRKFRRRELDEVLLARASAVQKIAIDHLDNRLRNSQLCMGPPNRTKPRAALCIEVGYQVQVLLQSHTHRLAANSPRLRQLCWCVMLLYRRHLVSPFLRLFWRPSYPVLGYSGIGCIKSGTESVVPEKRRLPPSLQGISAQAKAGA